MTEPGARASAPSTVVRPSRGGLVAALLFFAAVVARTLAWEYIRHLLLWYLGGEALFLLGFLVLLWRPALPAVLRHIYFAAQIALILRLYALWPDFDFVLTLLVLLAYQAALAFAGRARWIWIGAAVLTMGVATAVYSGVRGLAQELLPMGAAVAFAAYVAAQQDLETARARSQTLLAELQASHRDLQAYAGQVEELAALQERQRLTRHLDASVSQSVFRIAQEARAVQLQPLQDPEPFRQQLEQLQTLAQETLAEMRGIIGQLRPKA